MRTFLLCALVLVGLVTGAGAQSGSGSRWTGDMCHSPGAISIMESTLNEPGVAELVIRDVSTALYDENAGPGQVSLVCHLNGVVRMSRPAEVPVSGTMTIVVGTRKGLWNSPAKWTPDAATSATPTPPAVCDRPPYGASVAEYRAFTETFSKLLEGTSEVLAASCRIKFQRGDRTPLYKLGFTDRDIDTKSTTDLALAEMKAIRALLRNE